MAIGWMTIVKNVPWAEVIRNTPVVVDSARKLWRKAAGKADPPLPPAAAPDAADPLAALQTQIETLHAQMLASSEMIQTLAEQNAQLIARLETHRRRLFWLTIATAAALLLALAGWLR
ncbi:MAG: hypothetical protein LBE62_11155 [Azonexus sp.]|jgi:hypothetical protein|nr:hypothetical protein [Azonexus sp.]